MKYQSLLYFLIIKSLTLIYTNCYNTMPPTWVPTPDIKTFTLTFVDRIGSGSPYSQVNQTTVWVPFPSGVTFTAPPKVTMAIVRYQADNDLTNTFVIMYNTPGVVNTTAFELDHYINTLAWIVSYRVITRTSNYPYHFNLMNNLQVVSSTRNFATTTTYNVLKSYSSMSSGNTYTTFAQVNGSYSNMKIITYLSCFAFNGTGANPIVFIDTAIINATHMNFVLTFGATASLGRCHLNMIVYNQAQLQATGLYHMQYMHANFTEMGGQYPVPPQFQDSTMMGWTDYAATSSSKYISFDVTFTNLAVPIGNVSYGIRMPPASPIPAGAQPAQKLGISLFYLEYMTCSNIPYYYLNVTLQLCIQCAIIPNCLKCYNDTQCTQCNPGFVLNASYLCEAITCGVANCLACVNATACALCDYNNSYFVNSGGTCSLCDNTLNLFINLTSPTKQCLNCSQVSCGINCATNQYLNVANQTCILCSTAIANCAQCYYSSHCTLCSTGYILNGLTQCDAINCNITHCLTCFNATSCSLCDYNNSYYVDGAGGCSLCDNNLNLFINLTSVTKECVNCSQVSCGTLCQYGDYLDVLTQTCINCSSAIANCTQCYFAAHCLSCQPGLFINSSLLCELITCPSVSHCKICLNATACYLCDHDSLYAVDANGTCSLCDANLNMHINVTSPTKECVNCSQVSCGPACGISQYLDVSSQTCLNCSVAILHCVQCLFAGQCTVCQVGYFVNASLLCQPFVCGISDCILCLNTTACAMCDYNNSYALDSTLTSCPLCDNSLNMFINMTSPTKQCLNCSQVSCGPACALGHYLHVASQTCLNCSVAISHCLQCLFAGQCTVCDTGYFVNSSLLCQPFVCGISNCTLCLNTTACAMCDYNNSYALDSSLTSCPLCDNALNMFINMTSPTKECLNCSQVSCGPACALGQYLNVVSQTCLNCSVAIPYCLQCLFAGQCTLCQVGYFVNASLLCQKIYCGPQCLLCLNTTACLTCNYLTSYYLDNSTATCLYCDNSLNMYINLTSPTKQCMDCSLVQCNIGGNLTNATVNRAGCNSFVIYLEGIAISLSEVRNFTKILNPGVTITQIMENRTGCFDIHAEYTRDIVNQSIQLQIQGSVMNITYSPILPALYYSDSQCKITQSVTTLLKAYTGISYSLLILSLFSAKIVGLQLFGILQLSYFTLSSHSFLNLYLSPLLNFKIFNGYNTALYSQTNSNKLPPILKQMQLSTNFINNCNVMLLLFYAFVSVLGITCLVFKLLTMHTLYLYSMRALKQGGITLVIFNSFNVAFSAGVHWKYYSVNDRHFLQGTILSVLTFVIMAAIVVAMQISDGSTFGQFKNKFKNCQSQLFIPLLIFYRVALGLYCSTKSDYQLAPLIILGFSLIFFLYIIINLPFNDAAHNYRTFVIQITTLYIILMADYYRTMKSNTPLQIKAKIYLPSIIQLVLIGVCIFVSSAVIFRDVYQFIREMFGKNGKSSRSNSNKNRKISDVNREGIDKTSIVFSNTFMTEENMSSVIAQN